MQQQFAQAAGPDAAIDTTRYGQVNKLAHPVARGAAEEAGQFNEPVAEAVTKFAFLLLNLAQQQEIITEMQKAGALTEEKHLMRLKMLFLPVATDLVATGESLMALLDKHYPRAN
jgi:hypothetical protein